MYYLYVVLVVKLIVNPILVKPYTSKGSHKVHKVAKNLPRYTVYVIMFIHVIRVFVIVISLLFLELLLLLRHLLSNILVFSTQAHKHCNISSCINKGSFLMTTIYRSFIFGPKYVIFPPHLSPSSSPAPRGFSFSFPKQNSTTKQLSVCPLTDQTCNFPYPSWEPDV